MSPDLANPPKSARIAFFLCLFFGMFGIHRFYTGKIVTGALMLVTFGGLGIWVLIDLGNLVCNNFQDKNNNTLMLTQDPSLFTKIFMAIGAIIVGFVIFFISFCIVINLFMSDISDTARRQLSSLKSGDIEKAYSYTSSDFQKATSLEDYKKYVKHYPILTNYRNASATKLEKTNDNATAFFTLRTTDTNTPVEFRLIKENGQWKILAMEIGKTVAADNALVTVKTSIEFNDKAKDKTTSPISIALPELYKNESNRYSVKYPSDWETEVIGKGSIVFSGKKGSPSYSTGINIQAILTKNTGGLYSTVSEHIDADKKELATQLTNVKFLDQGEVELPQNPKQYKGEYLIFTYMNHGHEYKQMKFFILRDDKQLFYTWSYAAPIEEYNADLPINKAMFESWNIY